MLLRQHEYIITIITKDEHNQLQPAYEFSKDELKNAKFYDKNGDEIISDPFDLVYIEKSY